MDRKFVSRSGLKLEQAINSFNVDVKDKTCLDVGAAVGGFTDCLLTYGAKEVYAVEVGKNILDWKLRNDKRVVVMEKTNILYVDELPEKIDLVTIDVSFTPLKMVLPKIRGFLKENGQVIALLKPHYEAQDQSLLRKGVVKDDKTREDIVFGFLNWCKENNWQVLKMLESNVVGEGGNKERLVLLRFL